MLRQPETHPNSDTCTLNDKTNTWQATAALHPQCYDASVSYLWQLHEAPEHVEQRQVVPVAAHELEPGSAPLALFLPRGYRVRGREGRLQVDEVDVKP